MRGRGALIAGGVIAVAAAVWVLLDGGDGIATVGTGGDDAPGATGGASRGGVAASEVTSAEDRVVGRVVDEDGQPIREGTLVLSCLDSDPPGKLIRGGAVRLDEEGSFSGPGCRGRVCAQLRHASMIQADDWLLSPGRPVELTARMLGRLEGVLLDPEGEPVPAGELVMLPPPGDEDPTALPPFVSRNASTDADGRFSFFRLERPPCDPCSEATGRCDPDVVRDLPTYDSMLLTARANGFRMVARRVDAHEAGPLEIRLEAPAPALTGTLRDPEGRSYPRVRVISRSVERAYEQHAVVPDADAFRFEELGSGSYDLRAIQDGVELVVEPGRSAGEHVELVGEVSAAGPDVIVKVLDAGRSPLAGVVVDGGPLSGARTDDRGIVRATKVMPGPYTLRVRGAGVRAFSRRITVPETDERFSVELVAD